VYAPVQATDFLNLLRESGLAEPGSLSVRSAGSASELARSLVNEGVLTDFQAAQLLQGRYQGFFLAGGAFRVLDQLGGGGTAWVYLAEKCATGRLVAIKVLPPERARIPERREEFWREARTLVGLSQPHLVRLLEVVVGGKAPFQVQEYIDGTDLHALSTRAGKVDPGRVAAWGVQACRGLGCLHQQGLVHGDIKPGNLALSRQGVVKILDLGTVCSVGSIASTGTPNFVAPEQAAGQRIDERADLYGLGVTLVFLLTGLFRPELRVLDLPAGLRDGLARLLSPERADRFRFAEEAAQALAPWAAATAQPRPQELPVLCPALQRRLASLPPVGLPGMGALAGQSV
jgi:serine/threonine-protein kinase